MNSAQHVQLLLAAPSFLSPHFVVLPHLLQPVLFSCLLFLSHLIASSLCSSGFAFRILLLSSSAAVLVSLPRPLLYSCPLSPCQANLRALICVLVLPCSILHVLPTPPISSVQSSAMEAFDQHGGKVPLDVFSFQHSLSLLISSSPLHGFLLHGLQTPVSFWPYLSSFGGSALLCPVANLGVFPALAAWVWGGGSMESQAGARSLLGSGAWGGVEPQLSSFLASLWLEK